MFRMHSRRPLRLILLGGAALYVPLAPIAASAAEPEPADSTAGDTVVVTGAAASPAAQAAQARPQSATVVNAQQLQDNAAVRLQDIGTQTPGLVLLNNTPSPNNISAYIRGIGEPDAQGVPSTGIFIDGIYQPRNLGANINLLDVQDITIERGPVGWEGGHDAEAGAIRVTTFAPSNTPTLTAIAGYGMYNEWITSLIGSGPIVPDVLYGSLGIQHHQHDGFNSNLVTGKETNDADTTTVRGKLRYTPNDQFELRFGIDGTFDNSQARSYGNELLSNKYLSQNPIVPNQYFNQLGINLTASYKLSDQVKLLSITSIRGFFQFADYDNNPDVYSRNSQPVSYRDRSYEQDFRLVANLDKVDLIGGLYLFDEDWQTDRRGNAGTYPSNNNQIVYTPVDTQITQINTHFDVYGEAKIHITPQLTGTIGLRGDYQTHSNDQQMYTLLTNGKAPWTLPSGGLPDTDTILNAPRGALIWSTPGTVRSDYFTPLPRAVLEYAFNPDLKPYVSISQGQKDGGYDFRAILPTAEQQALLPYTPEHLTTAELGLKSKFLNDQLEFDTAAFYNYFASLQNTFVDPTDNLSHRYNIGNAYSYGWEAELTGHVTSAWSVNLSATLLNAELQSYKGVVHSVTYPNGFTEYTTPFPGAQLPYSPHAQGNIGTSYVLPLQVPGIVRIFGNVALSTPYYGDLTNINQQKIPGSAIVNAGFDWTSPNGRWNLSFTVRNLTDHRYPASISYTVITSGPKAGTPAFISTAWDDPLTAFAQLKLSL